MCALSTGGYSHLTSGSRRDGAIHEIALSQRVTRTVILRIDFSWKVFESNGLFRNKRILIELRNSFQLKSV